MNAVIFAAGAVELVNVIVGGIISIVAAVFAGLAMMHALQGKREVEQVHHEVRTMNELTLGQLGEATETRRIRDKPDAERTAQERRHTEDSDKRGST